MVSPSTSTPSRSRPRGGDAGDLAVTQSGAVLLGRAHHGQGERSRVNDRRRFRRAQLRVDDHAVGQPLELGRRRVGACRVRERPGRCTRSCADSPSRRRARRTSSRAAQSFAVRAHRADCPRTSRAPESLRPCLKRHKPPPRRSTTVTSIPRRARKYAVHAPMTPPPQITTCIGRSAFRFFYTRATPWYARSRSIHRKASAAWASLSG